jgi:hypothetical protein
LRACPDLEFLMVRARFSGKRALDRAVVEAVAAAANLGVICIRLDFKSNSSVAEKLFAASPRLEVTMNFF